MGTRFLTIAVGGYKQARGGMRNDPCGNGLESEISV